AGFPAGSVAELPAGKPALRTAGGLMVFICSSTWTKTAAAAKLRNFLRDRMTVARFLDFGDLQVFANVTTYPAIIIVEKRRPPRDHQIRASQVKTILPSELEDELHAPGILVPQAELEEQGWRFEDRRIARLRQKIRDAGKTVGDYSNGECYRGITTGLNEAFVIDQETRDALVADHPRSKEILKPFLEGKDLKPWRAEWRGLWLIRFSAGWTNKAGGPFGSEKNAFAFLEKRYSAVSKWLASFEKAARKRQDKGDWYWELRPCVYYDEFEKPKIMYPHFVQFPKFSFDVKRYFSNNKCYIIPEGSYFEVGLLNSRVIWFAITGMCTPKAGGFYELCTQFMETLPIASASPADKRKIASLAEALSSDDCPNRLALEAELNDRVAALYGLTAEERKIIVNPAE
ncbi:MAG: hypothetical protein NTW86_32660, partial [Candidatus Sumerlaeota bacterium]|nr:hypothetical protein [Candidatus Sumerlaeota bacterium]